MNLKCHIVPYRRACCDSFLHDGVTRALLWVVQLSESQFMNVTEIIMMVSHRGLKLD